MMTLRNVYNKNTMKEVLVENQQRLRRSIRTVGLIATKSFWADVTTMYQSRFGSERLPKNKALRAARYIFTEDGQVAYQMVKFRRTQQGVTVDLGSPTESNHLPEPHQDLAFDSPVSEMDSSPVQAPLVEELTQTLQLSDDR
jgi:hypothetical protein